MPYAIRCPSLGSLVLYHVINFAETPRQECTRAQHCADLHHKDGNDIELASGRETGVRITTPHVIKQKKPSFTESH
ncbi:MAG: hypothetical protein ACK55I_31350 [bacterium]